MYRHCASGAVLVLFSFLALGSAHRGQTKADNCRVGNAIGHMGQPKDRVAEAIEDQRCDNLAQQERQQRALDQIAEEARLARQAEQKRVEAEATQQQQAANLAAEADADARQRETRAHPKIPELRATVSEARAICLQQSGKFVDDSALRCTVGGRAIFVCSVDRTERVERCDGFYEGAELSEVRRRTETQYGPATSGGVTRDGFRIFKWQADGIEVNLAMYEHGVRVARVVHPAE